MDKGEDIDKTPSCRLYGSVLFWTLWLYWEDGRRMWVKINSKLKEEMFYDLRGLSNYNDGADIEQTFPFQNWEMVRKQGVMGPQQVWKLAEKIPLDFKAWD